ncbi:hypothetical protein A7P92_03275 [Eikenella corrodens]|nr:hypothetical protein A7P92_03275 [Eikenella corrodens]
MAVFFFPYLLGLPLRHGSGSNIEQAAVGYFLAQQLFDVVADMCVWRIRQPLQHVVGRVQHLEIIEIRGERFRWRYIGSALLIYNFILLLLRRSLSFQTLQQTNNYKVHDYDQGNKQKPPPRPHHK